LIARLQEQQNQQASSSTPAEGHSETCGQEENHSERQEESTQAVVQQKEKAMRRKEDEERVRELLAAKDAESAYLSKIVDSACVPDLSSERLGAVCDQESHAVVKCYASLRAGTEVRCGKFVDILEECALNQ
ncbi:unnamed protein product, partial [Hapterophycus canaliculatus]